LKLVLQQKSNITLSPMYKNYAAANLVLPPKQLSIFLDSRRTGWEQWSCEAPWWRRM